jgi:imidazolonepropionase
VTSDTPAEAGPRRLLVRDLAQLATPGGRQAPLRGAELGKVDVIEDAFVLCEAGRIARVGRMRDLRQLAGEVEELDGRGLSAIPGLVDCHTHACFAGDHAVPPEFEDAEAYLDFALAEVLPEASALAEAADVFVEEGAFDIDQARRYLEACREAGLALRLHGDQFTERGAVGLAIELGARSLDHLEATGSEGVRFLARSEVCAVLLPASALYLGRPMPPARALVDAGATVVLATDFNPGSAFCESLPLVCSLACTQLHLSPGEALAACTVNAAHVLARADKIGRIAAGYDADLVLLDAPDWRHLAYHLGGDLVAAAVIQGQLAWCP